MKASEKRALKKTSQVWDGQMQGKTASVRGRSYKVAGHGLDANGCLITYDGDWQQSFVDETQYS